MALNIPHDDGVLDHCTPRQAEILQAYWRTGSYDKVAAEFGLSVGTVYNLCKAVARKLARKGIAPNEDFTRRIPEGYRLERATTHYRRGESEPFEQWLKIAEDRQKLEEIAREIVAASAEAVERMPAAPPPKALSFNRSNMGMLYPIVDPHFGLYAWAEEAGGNYDLKIAEKRIEDCLGHLLASGPEAEHGIVAITGDLFHYDNLEAVTPTHRNLLDSDSRFGEVVRCVFRSVVWMIRQALGVHDHVHVIIQPGNHDPSSPLMLAEALFYIFENEPRLSIDRSPAAFHYHRFGSVLLGVCHGHEVKKKEMLPIIMATDRAQDWGETKHRLWISGHVHHERCIDIQGVPVWSFRPIAKHDTFAHSRGYRGASDMSMLMLHRENGQVGSARVNPDMFE